MPNNTRTCWALLIKFRNKTFGFGLQFRVWFGCSACAPVIPFKASSTPTLPPFLLHYSHTHATHPTLPIETPFPFVHIHIYRFICPWISPVSHRYILEGIVSQASSGAYPFYGFSYFRSFSFSSDWFIVMNLWLLI